MSEFNVDVPDELLSMLRRHEGFRSSVYQDHLGYWTIGFGRLVDERRGGGITREEANHLLRNDAAEVVLALDDRLAWWRSLDEARQIALANMAFQMGVDGLLGFRNTLSYLEQGRWDRAAREALSSRWAAQTPERAQEIAAILRTGRLE